MVGMAEGADLLVAEVALDRRLPVDAVLPMPLREYAEDFGAERLARLRELLERPEAHRIERAASVRPSSGIVLRARADHRGAGHLR
jgi:hypothetical protein